LLGDGAAGVMVAMMAEGKWIDDLTAATPLRDAARRVLTVRLEVVRDFLPLALHEADGNPEHIHQLRVATRRAGAALRIFACCLPDKVLKKAKKRLRKVRRAAAAARDWDVFLLSLLEWQPHQPAKQRPGLDFLIGYALAQRLAAQTRLQEIGKHYPFSFDRFLAETVVAVQGPASNWHTLSDLAEPLVRDLLAKLEEMAGGNLNDYTQLHQVRIAGKRLRYAMEVLAGCFPAPFREQLYPAVSEMQEILGNANDSHVASERLHDLQMALQKMSPAAWKRCKPGVEGLLRYHEARLPKEKQRFLEWWSDWQRSGGRVALAKAPSVPV
jgi:CHAD domain-containing protein